MSRATVLLVAEKPSIAKTLTGVLAGQQTTKVKPCSHYNLDVTPSPVKLLGVRSARATSSVTFLAGSWLVRV